MDYASDDVKRQVLGYLPAEHEAYELGVQHAKAAASWCVDGNTSAEHVARMVEMFDAGDPQLWDYLPVMPNLSGEYADDLTPRSLAASITGAGWDGYVNGVAPDTDALADAYEAGVSDTFESECERIIREAL
jgi:hypothetical protein